MMELRHAPCVNNVKKKVCHNPTLEISIGRWVYILPEFAQCAYYACKHAYPVGRDIYREVVCPVAGGPSASHTPHINFASWLQVLE